MKIKKIRMNLLALGVLATMITTSTPVFAATNNSTSKAGTLTSVQASTSATKSTKINSDTVITDDNIYDVVEYLGLDSNCLIKNDVPTEKSNVTVGDLQKAIKQAKKLPKTITTKPVTDKSNNTTTKSSDAKLILDSADDDDDTPVDSVYVHRNTNLGDGYSVTYSCSGQYRHGQWYGATDADASITSIAPLMSYTITDKDLSLTYDSDTITMQHSVTISGAYGVGKFSIPVFTGLVVTGTDKFNLRDWV